MRRLTPRELDAGMRDFDIGDQGTDRLPPARPREKLISWKGALVSPAAVEIERDEAHWDAIRQAMRPLVQEGLRAGTEPAAGEAYDPLVNDPVVGPPAYGALAAGVDRIPQPVRAGAGARARCTSRSGWVRPTSTPTTAPSEGWARRSYVATRRRSSRARGTRPPRSPRSTAS